MKRNLLFVAGALLAAAVVANGAAATRFVPIKAGASKVESSEVVIHGTSSLHEWEMRGSTINGNLDAELSQWPSSGDTHAAAAVSVPVASVHSDHSRMDRLMLEALKASKNAEIRYQLVTATPGKGNAESFVVHTSGKLTIAGATHDVTMDVTSTRVNARRYIVTGALPIRMTDYGITPPVAMMGTLKTGDAVKVSFRWIVERAE
jgi:polyisoprenoid-binding protein YceI